MKEYRIVKLKRRGIKEPYYVQERVKPFLGLFPLKEKWADIGYYSDKWKDHFHVRYFSTLEEAKSYVYDYLGAEKNEDGEPIIEIERFKFCRGD